MGILTSGEHIVGDYRITVAANSDSPSTECCFRNLRSVQTGSPADKASRQAIQMSDRDPTFWRLAFRLLLAKRHASGDQVRP